MASFFRTKVVNNIGTTPVAVLETVGNNRFTVIGCNLANITDNDVIIDLFVKDITNDIEAYYIKQLIIPPYNSAKVITNGEKLILAEYHQFTIVTDTTDSIDAVISYAEIV